MLNSLKGTYERGKGFFLKGTAIFALIVALSACNEDNKWKDNKELQNSHNEFHNALKNYSDFAREHGSKQYIEYTDSNMKTLYYASGPGLGARAVYKKETDDKEIEYTLSYQKPHISYTESRNGEITKGEVGDTAQMIGLYKELTKFINTHGKDRY